MAGWTDLLNPKLYFPGILCFFSSIIAEENSPSHGKRAWYSVYKVQKKKTIYCLSFWFKFLFTLSVNPEKYSHFIKLIQIESK